MFETTNQRGFLWCLSKNSKIFLHRTTPYHSHVNHQLPKRKIGTELVSAFVLQFVHDDILSKSLVTPQQSQGGLRLPSPHDTPPTGGSVDKPWSMVVKPLHEFSLITLDFHHTNHIPCWGAGNLLLAEVMHVPLTLASDHGLGILHQHRLK